MRGRPDGRVLQLDGLADDNRISYGCVNLPVEFFDQVLWPTMRSQPGIVYVLPEHKALEQVFPGLTAPPADRKGG